MFANGKQNRNPATGRKRLMHMQNSTGSAGPKGFHSAAVTQPGGNVGETMPQVPGAVDQALPGRPKQQPWVALASISALTVVLWFVWPNGNKTGAQSLQLWVVLVIASVVALFAPLARQACNLSTQQAWRVEAAGALGLVFCWAVFLLPSLNSTTAFFGSAATAAAGLAAWTAPGRPVHLRDGVMPRIAVVLLVLSLGFPWVIRSGTSSTTIPGWYVPGLCRSVQDYDGWMSMECEPGSSAPPIFMPGSAGSLVPGYGNSARFGLIAAVLLVALGIRRSRPTLFVLASVVVVSQVVFASGARNLTAGIAMALIASALLLVSARRAP